MAAKSKCAASAPHLPEAVRYPPSGSKARSARIACPKAPPAPSRPKTMPAASFCCNARIHSSSPVSSASSADTVAAFAVERESLIRVSLAAGGDDLPAKRVGAELVALSLVRANCLKCEPEAECWLPLSSGFVVPLDDVRDLVPTESSEDEEAVDSEEAREGPHEDSRRADMLFISVASKGRLQFRFAEVKYRRHLS